MHDAMTCYLRNRQRQQMAGQKQRRCSCNCFFEPLHKAQAEMSRPRRLLSKSAGAVGIYCKPLPALLLVHAALWRYSAFIRPFGKRRDAEHCEECLVEAVVVLCHCQVAVSAAPRSFRAGRVSVLCWLGRFSNLLALQNNLQGCVRRKTLAANCQTTRKAWLTQAPFSQGSGGTPGMQLCHPMLRSLSPHKHPLAGLAAVDVRLVQHQA